MLRCSNYNSPQSLHDRSIKVGKYTHDRITSRFVNPYFFAMISVGIMRTNEPLCSTDYVSFEFRSLLLDPGYEYSR